MNITPTDNTIYWYSESGKYVYGNTNSGTWNYFNDDKAISKAGSGTGNAGTWVESWETENDADIHWDSSVFGGLQNGSESGKWNRHKNSTPSNSTGPSSASDGTWYLYTETSNNGHTTKFDLSTTNFATLKSIKFRYSMYGDDCGTLEFKTINSNGETTHYSVSGNQGQSWQEASIDLSDSGAEKIEFMYSGSKGWKADMALDKITIVSE